MKNLSLKIVILVFFLAACAPTAPVPVTPANQPAEVPIQPIALAGLASLANAELSGLAWYGDWLILLPQYPNRFPGGGEGALLALARRDILAYLDGQSSAPLLPRSIPLIAPDLSAQVRGYEGFEAVAIVGDQIFLTIETNSGAGMLSYLVSGAIAPDLSAIRLNTGFLRQVPAQAAIANFSDEAIVAGENFLLTLYESNGLLYNPKPVAHRFNLNLTAPQTVPFPTIEYRITDATPLQLDGTFWAINYFFPGDTKIAPTVDPIASRYGRGATHARYPEVERLVQFQYRDNAIQLVDRPPIQLSLVSASTARNWEGLATLDKRGFLVVTDQYPETILAFIPLADE